MKKLIRITTIPISLKILLKGQLQYMNQYYEVIGISSGEGLDEILKEQGVRGYRVGMTRKITPLHDLISLFRLIRIFIKEKPDIVHTHTPKAGTLGMIAAWITKVPHRLHTVAGLPLLITTGKKRYILELVEKLTYACATTIYSNSFKLKDIIISLKLITSSSKIKVIGNGSSNGIDIGFYSRLNISIKREELKIPNNKFVFIFIGRIVKDKGINELISAFTKLYTINNKIHLILVGPFEKDLDPLSPETEKIILSHPNITFTGFQKDVRPYFAASDALVFPSYREGFPNVVLQAGAMGLPSIVTDINGCNEIIIEGKNGIIIPPKDENALYKAMEYFIIYQNDKVKEMAQNARPMIAERYEQHKVWEALLKEYQSLN